jgi:hypothetical protein
VCASFIYHVNVLWINKFIKDATLFNTFSQVISATTCLANIVTQVLCLKNGKHVLRILDHVSVLDSENSGTRISYYRLYKTFIFLLIYSITFLLVPNIMSFAALDTNSLHILEIVYYSTVYFISYVFLMLSDTNLFILFSS